MYLYTFTCRTQFAYSTRDLGISVLDLNNTTTGTTQNYFVFFDRGPGHILFYPFRKK